MSRKLLFVFLVVGMVFSLASVSAQDDLPTVAIIRLGPLPPFQYSTQGTMDVLAAYGYVDGENIHVELKDAAMDVPTANLLVQDALDEGADYLVTITTPVSIAAANATQDMEDPPIVLFNTVTDPYAAKIVQSPCIKPANIWGSQALPDFENIFPIMWEVNPDIKRVGWIYSTTEVNAVKSTEIAQPLADKLGFTLVIKSVTESSEVSAAADAIANEGVDAFFIPTDNTVGGAIAVILAVAEQEGIPVFMADSLQVFAGVTVGAGVSYYQEGVDTGRVLVGLLNGDVDLTSTAVSKQSGTLIGVNLDTAAGAGVEIPQEFLDKANFIIKDGENTGEVLALPDVSHDEMVQMDKDFIDSLYCSEDRIAEEQATLDAASS